MQKHISKRRVVVSAIVVLALAIAGGVAFAYWTASGPGQDTAAVEPGSDVSIVVEDMGSDLYPGGDATITFHVHNNSTTASVRIDKVVQDGDVTGLPVGCLASDFVFDDVTVNQTIAAGDDGASVTGTLHMLNTALNQDLCKGEAPVLHLITDNSAI
jgi:hypothetical protein